MNFFRKKHKKDDVFIKSYSDNKILSKSVHFFLKKEDNINKIPYFSYIFAIFLCIFFIIILFFRLFYLQTYKFDYFNSLSYGNRERESYIKPKRGIIYDKDFNKLVYNIPKFQLYYIPYYITDDLNELIVLKERLINELGLSEDEVSKISFADYIDKKLIKEIYNSSLALDINIKIKDFPGFYLESSYYRKYDDLDSLSHILGYVSSISPEKYEKNKEEYLPDDTIGDYGIELYYEDYLRGELGLERYEVDSLGYKNNIISTSEPKSGYNLKLTIDYDLQKKSEEVLKKVLDENDLEKGVVIFLDPDDGSILSMVSMPTFSSNDFSLKNNEEITKSLNDENNPMLNRAISGRYAPASTFKIVMGAIGLEEDIISTNTVIQDRGYIRVVNIYNPNVFYYYRSWESTGLGYMNIYDAIARSSNIYFYYVGGGHEEFKGLGIAKMNEYFDLLKLDEKTGIDLSYEITGFTPTPEWKKEVKGESWTLGNTYYTSIGQGDLLLTPIQIINYVSYFAKEGKNFVPHFLDSVYSQDGDLIYKYEDQVIISNIFDDYNTSVIREGMKKAVTSGTCVRLNSLNKDLAAKTGTAQVAGSLNNALLVGFGPYDDPQFVFVIIIEEGGEGSETAMDVAYEIIEYYFNR